MNESRDNEARESVRGSYLLFARGKRPDRAAIHEFIKTHPAISLTHDPVARPPLHIVRENDTPGTIAAQQNLAAPKDRLWVELLSGGLTFDLEGLAPAAGLQVPKVDYFFDTSKEASASRAESIRLVPGLHLAGGEASLPVLRCMLGLARDLVQHFEEIEAVIWPPSSSVIGRRFFESTTTAWLEGGAFPALGLTAFRETIDGGLQSVGLDFLIGQELRIEPSLAGDKVAATRMGVRLINQLVLSGPVTQPEQLVGPNGDRLQLEPSSNGKYIRVWGN